MRSVDFLNLWAKFCKILKIRGYVAQQPKWQLFLFHWLTFFNYLCAEFFFFFHPADQNHSKPYLSSFKFLFSGLCMIFFAELLHFKQKKLIFNFDAWYLANQTTSGNEKKQIEAERCKFHVKPLEFPNTHFYNIFFSSFRSRKKCEERRRLEKGTLNLWNTLSEWPNFRF